MPSLMFSLPSGPEAARTRELFGEHFQANARRTDRMFAVLMMLQWLAAIAVALILTPRTWNGAASQTHPHVWVALIFGGVLASLPVLLAFRCPGSVLTRHVIGLAQMMFSSLFIHLSGGRIETHFHVFGSLAFLAFYRDWKVLVPATLLVAADHFLRGVFWPESVFGIVASDPWRWVEHAGWVIYEDVFLVMACHHGARDMWANAARMADLERVNRDIQQQSGELEVARDAAEAANHAKSAFLANMSHEIRTPLNAILGFADVLMQQLDGDKEARRDHVQTIHDSGRHLLTLINDVLDLSKIEAGQMEMEHMRCSPKEIIAATISILRVRAEERGLALDYFWKGEIPEFIFTDSARFRQVLMNLVGNAIKFTEVGSVQVIARLQLEGEPRLLVDVIDTGVGIPSDGLERIFDPFVQADSSITRRFGGTGLGLSISRRIARLLGGELTVNSELGRGSIFSLSIPTGPLEAVRMTRGTAGDVMLAPRALVETAPRRTLPPCKILLVDDGATNRKLMTLVLQQAGAQVVCAENGQTAVAAARITSFDLILMDMQMPVMDGYSATRELRRTGCQTPIVALTAHAMSGDERKCREAGCSDYWTKPIDPPRLIAAVAAVLEAAPVSHPAPGAPAALVAGPIVSTLPMEDSDYREIVEEYVVRLEQQIGEARVAISTGDAPHVARMAHWLKGSAGTVGFPDFTEPATRLHQFSVQGALPEMRAELERIDALFRRISIVVPA